LDRWAGRRGREEALLTPGFCFYSHDWTIVREKTHQRIKKWRERRRQGGNVF
jgi:hypothetical protein